MKQKIKDLIYDIVVNRIGLGFIIYVVSPIIILLYIAVSIWVTIY